MALLHWGILGLTWEMVVSYVLQKPKGRHPPAPPPPTPLTGKQIHANKVGGTDQANKVGGGAGLQVPGQCMACRGSGTLRWVISASSVPPREKAVPPASPPLWELLCSAPRFACRTCLLQGMRFRGASDPSALVREGSGAAASCRGCSHATGNDSDPFPPWASWPSFGVKHRDPSTLNTASVGFLPCCYVNHAIFLPVLAKGLLMR